MQSAGYDAYQRIQTETATPGQLIAMLYDAFVRNLVQAEEALESTDLQAAHQALLRGQDIVLELISSLDVKAEGAVGETARQIAPLYDYMYRRLIQANIRKDVEAVREVLALILPVRDAWSQALIQTARDGALRARTGKATING